MDTMHFSDPEMCPRCQNHGYTDKLVNGECHRCNVRLIHDAAVTAQIRAIFRTAREEAHVA